MKIHDKYFEDINNKYNRTYTKKSLNLYYKILPKYVNFLALIKKPSAQAKEIIKYVIQHNINMNEYVDFTNYVHVPLYIYIFHIDNIELVKAMKYLILEHKIMINYDLKIDNIGPPIPHFLITCNAKYIKYIKYNECAHWPKLIEELYVYMFINGLIDRYHILAKYIDFNNLSGNISGPIIYEMLISLLSKIQIICLAPDTNKMEKLFNNYIEIFKIYKINPFVNNICLSNTKEDLYQICLNWYLVPFIKYFQENGTGAPEGARDLYYYKDFNIQVCAFFRQLFNDRNYSELCNLLNKEIDIRAY
jgi:hypothetical protein